MSKMFLQVQAARGFVDTLEPLEGQSRADMEGSVNVVFGYVERLAAIAAKALL